MLLEVIHGGCNMPNMLIMCFLCSSGNAFQLLIANVDTYLSRDVEGCHFFLKAVIILLQILLNCFDPECKL